MANLQTIPDPCGMEPLSVESLERGVKITREAWLKRLSDEQVAAALNHTIAMFAATPERDESDK